MNSTEQNCAVQGMSSSVMLLFFLPEAFTSACLFPKYCVLRKLFLNVSVFLLMLYELSKKKWVGGPVRSEMLHLRDFKEKKNCQELCFIAFYSYHVHNPL